MSSENASVSLREFNALPAQHAEQLLIACCGSTRWVRGMLARRPFFSRDEILRTADDIWRALGEADWMEAFRHHPRIGESRSAAPAVQRSQEWSAGEQATVALDDGQVKAQLARMNADYEQRFGFIYIVCATGRSASELLALATRRMLNEPAAEMHIAAHEQRRITRLRLEKLLKEDFA